MAESKLRTHAVNKYPSYYDVIKCRCFGDIDRHWELNPELTLDPVQFYKSFQYCTPKGRKKLTETIERAQKRLRKWDQEDWLKVLKEMTSLDPVNDELDEKQAEAVKLLNEMTSLGSPDEIEEEEAIENLLKM